MKNKNLFYSNDGFSRQSWVQTAKSKQLLNKETWGKRAGTNTAETEHRQQDEQDKLTKTKGSTETRLIHTREMGRGDRAHVKHIRKRCRRSNKQEIGQKQETQDAKFQNKTGNRELRSSAQSHDKNIRHGAVMLLHVHSHSHYYVCFYWNSWVRNGGTHTDGPLQLLFCIHPGVLRLLCLMEKKCIYWRWFYRR